MPELMLLNPRRRGRRRRKASARRTHRRRRRAVTIMQRNPVRRRRRRSYSFRKNPRRRRYRFRRNPTSLGSMLGRRRGVEGFVNSTLIPSAVGALGGVLLDTALAYVPLPASLLTPTMQPFVRIGGAALLAMLAENFAGARIGAQIGLGAVTVTLYELASSWFAGLGGYVAPPAGSVPAVTPQGQLGYYSPAYQTGYYSRPFA